MKNVYTKFLLIILVLILILPSYGYSKGLNIVTTLRFLKDITQEIGQNKVNVISILKGTENPHTYEAKPRDIIALSKADIFIEIGGGLEGFVDKILKNVKKKDLKVVVLTKGIKLIGKNPHIWLDPENGKIIALKIKNVLSEKDPEDKLLFEKNLNLYIKKIEEIEKDAKERFSQLKDKRVVSSLPSFVYFYKRFGFTEVGRVVDLPGHEPSLKKIRDLIVLIKKEKIPYLVTNPLVKVKPVKIIKEETGIKEVKLLPLLYPPFKVEKYLDMLKYNVDAFFAK